MNNTCINGRLTKDPERKDVRGDTTVCEFSVAVNSREKVDGEWADYPSFFDVIAFGKTADRLIQHMEKGCMVGITGRLKQERWEKDGQKRSKIILIANDVEFLTWPENGKANKPAKAEKDPYDDELGY